MREIEFRLWNGVLNDPSQSRYFYDFPNVFDCLKQQLIFNDNSESLLGYNHIGDGSAFEQYTGLKDKNGVKIFEGDICKVTYYNHSMKNSELIQTVIYDLGTFSLRKDKTNSKLEEDRTFVPLYYSFAPNKIEVIGNIHQNPELL